MPETSRRHEFLVGVDSDGCAFDTMEIKHKECFIPHFIEHYGLQGVSKYAREAFEFVNLYSKSRGVNRFPALIEALEWLAKRPEVEARGVQVRIPAGLAEWVRRETRLANATLAAAAESGGDADLHQALAWSNAVNASIGRMVHGVPPFPFVRQSLEKLAGRADLLVVSATPREALEREWQEHDLAKYVQAICGQENGTKSELLACARKYGPGRALMIGDALGDYRAAEANGALFFPINPGAEQASWQQFYEEGSVRFLAGRFAGDYQRQLLDEFNAHLPAEPRWLAP
jgi:phosphoglycolate phosphatase-like HAD superfamily hydrolase